MTDNYVIKVEGVSKSFRIPHERHNSLKALLLNFFRAKTYTEHKALTDINFEVKKGEFFGIIGRNGSGKSTLLKILAGIYVPDKGRVRINGRMSPFLELGVGFNPELTARENIYLNGAILGLTRSEIRNKFDEIVSFAELEEFVDQRIKNFSSGMQVRLAFSVAIQAHAEVLLVDEVLAVGDANFQQKCFKVFKRLKREGRTIVFVTHDMNSIREFCDRALFIKDSKIRTIGSVEKAIQSYNVANVQKRTSNESFTFDETNRWGDHSIMATEITLSGADGKARKIFKYGEDIVVTMNYKANEAMKNVNIGFAIFRNDGTYCFDTNTDLDKVPLGEVKNDGTISLRYKNVPLQNGQYFIKVGIYQDYNKKTLDFIDYGPEFSIEDSEHVFGIVNIEHEWKL